MWVYNISGPKEEKVLGMCRNLCNEDDQYCSSNTASGIKLRGMHCPRRKALKWKKHKIVLLRKQDALEFKKHPMFECGF
jgi:hypothetical protein